MIHWSHNEFHLGDNLIHLHFLRKLALRYPQEQFRHAVHDCHLAQLQPVVEDLLNVRVLSLADKPQCSVNVWKNAGATLVESGKLSAERYVPGFWEQHRFRNNYAWFYIEWFHHLAHGMGLESPIKTYQDLWFDYPELAHRSPKVMAALEAIGRRDAGSTLSRDASVRLSAVHAEESSLPRFDFLVVNSQPSSGQLRAYDSLEYLSPLIQELAAKGHSIITTQPIPAHRVKAESGKAESGNNIPCTMDFGLSITEIGALSLHADHLVMVSTGPSWPTFNVWNEKAVKLRLLLLDTEMVDYMPNILQVNTREKAREILVERWLV